MELKELCIKNLGIIEDLTWQPSSGLNIITGETGAGKSLIIESLDILFFSKADDSLIRHGADSASVEAYFSFNHMYPKSVAEILNKRKIECDTQELIVEAHLRRQGRSVFRINGTPVPKTFLATVGQLIIDLHTQTQHLTLFNASNHLEILDSFAHVEELKKEYISRLNDYQRLLNEKKALDATANDIQKQRDFVAWQVEELGNAELKYGEDSELEAEYKTLASAENIRDLGQELHQTLTGGTNSEFNSVIDSCGRSLEISEKLASFDTYFSPITGDLIKIYETLEDIGKNIRRYLDNIDTTGERLEEVAHRLEHLKALKRKYNRDIKGLIELYSNLKAELEKLENIPITLNKLGDEIKKAKTGLTHTAIVLSETRKKAAIKLAANVNKELNELEMAGMNFNIGFDYEVDTENGLILYNAQPVAFNKHGIDKVSFVASTNPGEPLKPLQNIASTGEASRFTLAIKNVLAQTDSVPIIILDEIDIGIGGRSGGIIGKKIWALSRHHQVICITHLAQIAVFADSHFKVEKTTDRNRNVTQVQKLDDSKRLQELAEMLLSKAHSEKGLQAASDLSVKASEWKNAYS